MTKAWNRRTALAAALGTLAGAGKAWALPAGGKPTVEVWKSPTCGAAR